MKRRIGILTSGGDCPGLNATIRGVAKACYHQFGNDVEIVGIQDGYHGLIHNLCKEMVPSDFSGILTTGGTIFGTKRTPFKMMQVVEEDNIDKVKAMKQTYKKQKLDCLLTLGGNGTHKTANLLATEGLNVIGLPKTIDNDIWGTSITFGFHTAVDIATDVIDRLHTTANSHGRILVVEIMGNKAGWLTLYSGVAGGADMIVSNLLTEEDLQQEEANMKKKERAKRRAEAGITTATGRIAKQIEATTGLETRVCVPGHMLRGGSPSAYDRILATQFGVRAAQLIAEEKFGYAVAMIQDKVSENLLADVAGKTKFVPKDDQMVQAARDLDISFGD